MLDGEAAGSTPGAEGAALMDVPADDAQGPTCRVLVAALIGRAVEVKARR